MFNCANSKPPPDNPKVDGMYYRFHCFPNASGYVQLCDENFHSLGYAGSFRTTEEMLEIMRQIVIASPANCDTYFKFIHKQ